MENKINLSKSPIREVVFEIIFKKNLKSDPTIPGIFYEKIKDKFPNKKSVHEGMVEFQFNPKEKDPVQNFSESEIPQFLTPDGDIFILVKKDRISFHHLKQYTSWENFKKLVDYAVDNYYKVIEKESGHKISNADIVRFGLKFVNKISISNKNFSLDAYFNFRPSVIDKPENLGAFIVGSVYELNNNSLKIQLNTTKQEGDFLNFILNLDCFTFTINKDALSWSEEAHCIIEEKFFKALTNKTIKLFE